MGVVVVDNLNVLDDSQFIDIHWTTEHYYERGRKTIANNVACALKPLYPDEFVDKAYPGPVQTLFYNDCEGSTSWEPRNTITNEKAFSLLMVIPF